ncbi:hypothetical protein EDC04DRAFT_2658441 [Pisolithus marmoratus]|nr:hypothetical protein EDC04DRAFT_2658441 [Pisolithus marmoratus]
MAPNSIPSICISHETNEYQIPSSLHYPTPNSDITHNSEGRGVTVPSISQSSEAFDLCSFSPVAFEDLLDARVYTKDDSGYPSGLVFLDDESDGTNFQPSAFDGERLKSELYAIPIPFMSGPAGVQTITTGGMDNNFLSPSSPSPSSYNGSQSPASVHSEFSSDLEYSSPTSSVAPEETYPPSPCYTGRRAGHPYLHRHHVSYESIPAADHVLPTHDMGHHRSYSASSQRTRIATQAMLDANERRRVHEAQFECEECHQTFTAQFSLKRHQQSHTGERRFMCSIPGCNQKFFNNSDCKRHEKSKKRHPNHYQS